MMMTVAGDKPGPPHGASCAQPPDTYDPWKIESMPAGMIDSPLDFIFAEHHRQRQAALMLNLIADGGFDDAGIRRLVGFLKTDFALHVADEELGFFPLLRAKSLPEDNIETLTARFSQEHKDDESIGDEVVRLLEDLLSGRPLGVSAAQKIRVFAEHVREHLAVENAVLLPIARVRMDAESLKLLSEILKERRASQGAKRN